MSKVVEKGYPALRNALREYAIKKGRNALLAGADQLSNRIRVDEGAVLEAIDSGGIRAAGSTHGAAKRLTDLAAAQGETYAEVVRALETKGVPGPVAGDVADEIIKAGEAAKPNTMLDEVPSIYQSEAKRLLEKVSPESTGPGQRIGLEQMENLKRSAQGKVKYDHMLTSNADREINAAHGDVASFLKGANERAIARASADAAQGGTLIAPENQQAVIDLAEGFVPIKNRLGHLIEARNAAVRGAARASQRTNDAVGSAMTAAMLQGGGPQAAVQALPMALAKSIWKGRGASSMAVAARALQQSPALKEATLDAASWVPNAVTSAERSNRSSNEIEHLLRLLRGEGAQP